MKLQNQVNKRSVSCRHAGPIFKLKRNAEAIFLLALLASAALAQKGADPKRQPVKPKPRQDTGVVAAIRAESQGVEVRIKDIARFRGVRSNQLQGIGVVIGLEGTGDSKKTPFTATLIANAMRKYGTQFDVSQFSPKNVATVTVTSTLPPFASPGNEVDVTVQSIGDAKSLQGGFLLQVPLYGAADSERAYVVAQGALSIGGFNANSGGSSVQKNHLTVGRIPGGGIVENAIATQTVFPGGKMYLELDDADMTTAQRVANKLSEAFPQYGARAVDGGTIELSLPEQVSAVRAMSEIELTTVFADIPAVVVVNERTGTIVMGGNVKLGPAVVAHGSLQVAIQVETSVSQPNPLSNGTTQRVDQSTVEVKEEKAQVALIPPTATVKDLARIFQALRISPRDIIAILQALKEQGSLKARIKVQ